MSKAVTKAPVGIAYGLLLVVGLELLSYELRPLIKVSTLQSRHSSDHLSLRHECCCSCYRQRRSCLRSSRHCYWLLQRYFARHEFSAPYLLCCSDCEPLTLASVIEAADDDSKRRCCSWSLFSYSPSHGFRGTDSKHADGSSCHLATQKLLGFQHCGKR